MCTYKLLWINSICIDTQRHKALKERTKSKITKKGGRAGQDERFYLFLKWFLKKNPGEKLLQIGIWERLKRYFRNKQEASGQSDCFWVLSADTRCAALISMTLFSHTEKQLWEAIWEEKQSFTGKEISESNNFVFYIFFCLKK